jgi:hypothetical protein
MNRKIKLKDFRAGMLVVSTDRVETQVYTVESIKGYWITLVWREGDRMAVCGMDSSMLMTPTLEQIEYSINANGRLANILDVADVKFVIG